MKTKAELRERLEEDLAKEWARRRFDNFGAGLHVGPFRYCLLCKGYEPTELAKRNYIKEAIGHKPGCENE